VIRGNGHLAEVNNIQFQAYNNGVICTQKGKSIHRFGGKIKELQSKIFNWSGLTAFTE
jgi:hypothetical protein